MRILITIDGPSGVGKTSLSKKLSECLNMKFLSSGLLFRIIAYNYLNEDDKSNIKSLINESNFIINNFSKLDLNYLYLDKISQKASEIAQKQDVRNLTKQIQRDYINKFHPKDNFIIEGRDCGSEIFPEADIKIFLTAASEVRVQRRCLQLKDVEKFSIEISTNLLARDYNDINRNISPLRASDDAYIIDSTNMSIDETFNCILNYILSHKSYQESH